MPSSAKPPSIAQSPCPARRRDQHARHQLLPLLARLCRWFHQYETWLLSQRPKSYGRLSLEGWSKAVMPRSKMAAAWEALAQEFDQQIAAVRLSKEPAA